MKKHGCLFLATLTLMFALSAPRAALADDTIKHPGDHPNYTFEIEPHGLLGWAYYGTSLGFGVGGRMSIIVAQNGFISTLNNSVGVTFGVDYLYYSGCGYLDSIGCGASILFFPIAMQWNFYVAKEWSVFGEPGIFIYHNFVDTSYCTPGFLGCTAPTTTGVGPEFFLGGRLHFSEHVALTMRVGYPTLSVGASFM